MLTVQQIAVAKSCSIKSDNVCQLAMCETMPRKLHARLKNVLRERFFQKFHNMFLTLLDRSFKKRKCNIFASEINSVLIKCLCCESYNVKDTHDFARM